MRKGSPACLLLLALTALPCPGQAQKLTASPSTVVPGQTITATFSGAPGNERDWVALFAWGSDNRSYLAFRYTAGQRSGSLTLPAPTAAGRYELRLLIDDGFHSLATSNPIEVRTQVEEMPGAVGEPRLELDQPEVVPGGGALVHFLATQGSPRDWVGLYPEGADDHHYIAWQYTLGARDGTLLFSAPAEPGCYAFRLFADNGYTRLATSSVLTVVPSARERGLDLNGMWRGDGGCEAIVLQEGTSVTVAYAQDTPSGWGVWIGRGRLDGRHLRLDLHASVQARPDGLGDAVATLEVKEEGRLLVGSLAAPGQTRQLHLQRVPASGERVAPRPSPATETSWTANAIWLRGRIGELFTFGCPAGGSIGPSTWGTDLYTDDSSICVAAVHAGAITAAAGGQVTIEIRPGASSYRGSARNGVTSKSWQSWTGSFVFVRPGAGVLVEEE